MQTSVAAVFGYRGRMRSRIFSLAVLTVAAGCGGGNAASNGAKTPGDVDASAPLASGSAPGEDAGPPTTTTSTLGGTGDSPTKLDPTPSASAPAPSGSGRSPDPGRSAKDIEALVKAHRDEARKCYDDNIKAHPGVEGDLVVHWIVDAKGAVTTIELNTQRSQITEPTIVACVVSVIKGIQFAPSPKGFESTYNYPFNFHPRIR
jgi:hypothetical protein